jgi:hypothetical protein
VSYRLLQVEHSANFKPAVTELCTIDCYLKVDFYSLPSFVGPDNVERRTLNIDLVMSPCGTDLQFAVRYERMDLPTVS